MARGNDTGRPARVLSTGAARGLAPPMARRLHERGARVALRGVEPDELVRRRRRDCGDAPWWEMRREATASGSTRRSRRPSSELGGLDVVVANAGVAAQLPLVGGDRDLGQDGGGQPARRLQHAARRRARTSPTRAATRCAVASLGRRRPPAADGRLQRLEGGRRGARATRSASSCGPPAPAPASPTSPSSTPT